MSVNSSINPHKKSRINAYAVVAVGNKAASKCNLATAQRRVDDGYSLIAALEQRDGHIGVHATAYHIIGDNGIAFLVSLYI